MTSISRRNLFKYGLGAVGSGAVSLGLADRTFGITASPATQITDPDRAIAMLYQGNQRFAKQKVQQPNRGSFRIQEVAKGQKPFASILGCADSRVPTEIVFDQGLGDLFVVRVAGNIATSEDIGSLEFGALILGTPVILVLGHERCGAVTAAIDGKPVPGKIQMLVDEIKPAVVASANQPGDKLKNAIVANVKNQIITLSKSPELSKLIAAGKLKIVGGYYDLDTAVVSPIV